MLKRKVEVEMMPQVKTEALTDTDLKLAAEFLERYALEILIAFKDDARCPPWAPPIPGLQGCRRCGWVHGDHYRVTLRRKGTAVTRMADRERYPERKHALSFDFWGSLRDQQAHRRITPFDVLASVADDVNGPTDTMKAIVELGLNPQTVTEYRSAKRIAEFNNRLHRFFAPEERLALSDWRPDEYDS